MKINENMENLYFELAAIFNIGRLDITNSFIISEIGLRILNIYVLLIKVSIADVRRLILHYIGICLFFMAAVRVETIQSDGWDPGYRVLTR